jgi:hypothetical protein
MSSASSRERAGFLGFFRPASAVASQGSAKSRRCVCVPSSSPPAARRHVIQNCCQPRAAREREALVEQWGQEGHALGVERVAEARADAPPGEEPEDALVVRRAAARAGRGEERVEEAAVRLGGPLGAVTEDPLQLAQEILRFAPARVTSRLAEGAVQ